MTPNDPGTSRIEWDSVPPVKPVRKSRKLIKPPTGRVDWGTGDSNPETTFAALVGVEDAFDHTPLEPGEKVAFCTADRVAYHLSTWHFLRNENGGRCCICGRSNVIRLIELPALPQREPGLPVAPAVSLPPPLLTPSGLQIISLKDVHNFLNLAVVVQDHVHEVYQTKATGTVFIRFEPREKFTPPFEGFKVVIFKKYLPAWDQMNILPKIYEGQTIRVRGLIQRHPEWGIEILVNSPRVIEVVQPPSLPAEEFNP